METRKRLGEILIEQGKLTEENLIKALNYQKIHRLRLGEVLMEMGLITEDDLLAVLSLQLGVPYIQDNKDIKIDKELLAHIPLYSLKANQFIPLHYDGDGNLLVLCNDFYNNNISELCLKIYKKEPLVILAKSSMVLKLIDEYAREKDRIESLANIKGSITSNVHIYDLNARDDSHTTTEVNYILLNAYRMRASDIHLTQEENLAYLQYRIDGILQLIDTYPVHKSNALVSRIKNMSGVSSTEKRRAQDGGFQAIADGFNLDMRLSTMPSIYGESLVLRLLDRRYIDTITIEDLGFNNYNKRRYLALLENPNGILAVTGPTGSGKTSTIYSSLKLLNTGERAIHSIEDPVEYKISGIVSTQVNEKSGVTFASGLRALVRQDPDIIFIGETRDAETAHTAMNASNTGQFVLTTLHTNDSVSAISRLLNLGVMPYQMIDAFLGATAQVLVRKICHECGGEGCPTCNNCGFFGRTPLQEVMIFSENMKDALLSTTNLYTLRKIALKEGLIPMVEDGFEKVQLGITTRSEVLRVARKINIETGHV